MVRVLLLGELALLGGVGAVDKGDEVGVERQDLADGAGDTIVRAQQAESLVGVLVAVAPGAPEEALAPVLLDAGGVGEDVADAGGQDDLFGAECDFLVALVLARDGEVRVVLLGGDLGDGAVGEGRRAVLGDLLAGSVAVVCGSDAYRKKLD